jgi:MFS family permease
MALNGAVWATVAVFACRLAAVPADVRARLRTASQHEHHGPNGHAQRATDPVASLRRHAYRLLVPLVVLAVCGTLVEDVANNWAVLFLDGVAGAPAAVGGLALTVALGAQFVGRLVGDPMTDRWGRAAVASTGGLVVAAGAALLVIVPAYPVPFVGFALAGFGCATLVPAAFAAAGRVPGLPEGTGIAVLGWLMRIGFLITSPCVGALADLTSLRTAMLIPVAAGLLAALLAHRRRAPRAATTPAAPTPG